MTTPFECSVCLESFDGEERVPTSFICGHSICLHHTIGVNKIDNCPCCNKKQPSNVKFVPNYNLRDCALLITETKTIENIIPIIENIEVIQKAKRTGNGKIEYKNGDVYEGDWICEGDETSTSMLKHGQINEIE